MDKLSFNYTEDAAQQASSIVQIASFPSRHEESSWVFAKTNDCIERYNGNCRYTCKEGQSCPINGACSCTLYNPFASFVNATKQGPCSTGGTLYVDTIAAGELILLCWNSAQNAPIFVSAQTNGTTMAQLTFSTYKAGPQPTITAPTTCTCEAVAASKTTRMTQHGLHTFFDLLKKKQQ